MDEKELLKRLLSTETYLATSPTVSPNHVRWKTNVSTIYPVSTKTRRLIEGMPFSQMPWKTEECKYFAPLRVVKMAWGFDKLFAEMKVKDAPALRAEMRDYLAAKDNTTVRNWDNWNSCRNNRHISNSSSPDTDIRMLSSSTSLMRLTSLKSNLSRSV